jgi:hypothetical protein
MVCRCKKKNETYKDVLKLQSLDFFSKENNAIATVDLETENITAIHGLGFKNWSNSKLDASDRDNGDNTYFCAISNLICIK